MLIWFVSFGTVAAVDGERSPGPLDPSTVTSLDVAETALLRTAPGIDMHRRAIALAAGARDKAYLLSNPVVDAGWTTIPIGPTNPRDLRAPFANVPSYSFGLSYFFELGKRGRRQAWAESELDASRAQLAAATRVEALALLESLALLAGAMLRADSAQFMVENGVRSVDVARSRFAQGFGSGLEVDRLELETARVRQRLSAAHAAILDGEAGCASVLGARCSRFADAQQARRFLEHWIQVAQSAHVAPGVRPDLRAIDAERAAAGREASLAKASAIPDPTVRIGYVHDRFVQSGAQTNSVNLSVSLPIALFDQGQAELQAARAKARELSSHRERLVTTARARAPLLRARLSAARTRIDELSSQLVPQARAMLQQISTAAEGRLVSITDVIQAQRLVAELAHEEAEVYADAFETALVSVAEFPPATGRGVTP